ncbi:MAG: diguanylate cyclase [Magnetococcales bacterium]|nr:diguanylate cyclase [Magnetococcales bacterium]
MSTAALIETIYDLLRQKVPDPARVLGLVEQTLATGVCHEERRRGRELVEGLLDLLEKWQGANPACHAAIAECRQLARHNRDPDQFAHAAQPLFGHVTPLKGDTQTAKPAPELAGRLLQALQLLKNDRPDIATMLQSLPAREPSLEQLAHALDSLVLGPMKPVVRKDDDRLWDNVWRRLQQGMEEITAASTPTRETHALYQKKETADQSGDRASRIEDVLHQAQDWMRDMARIGQQLDDTRAKGMRLKQRIDELEGAIVQSQSAHFIDPNTGLSDHSGFAVHLNRLLDRASHLGEAFSLGVIRIGHYDTLATTLPLDRVDHLIRSLADAIRPHLATTDFIARIAPDRLGLLFPKTALDRCSAVINTLDHQLAETVLPLNPEIQQLKLVTGSMAAEPGMTVKEILTRVSHLAESIGKAPVAEEPKQWHQPVELDSHEEITLD